MTLTEMKTELTNVTNQINSLLETGQEYMIVGSHSSKNPDLAKLETKRAQIEQRILRYHGYNTTRSQAWFA